MQPKRKHLGAFSRGLLAAAIAIGVVAVVGVVLTTSSHSLAQPFTTFTIEDLGTSIGLGTADLKQTIVNIIRWVLGILALVAVSFIIYGGFLWMTARGDENRILKAKKVIAGAVIGLIIVLLSFAIVTFVAGTTSNVTNPGGGPGGVTPPPPPPATSFEIRSITTACGSPPNYRQDVFLCSGIVITFNHRVNAASVQAAVAAAGDDQLIIERCSDAGCSSATTVAPGIASQIYGGTSPTGVSAEWVTPTLGSQPGKSIVFYHKHELFEPDTYYRVRIPKAITDTSTPAQPIEYCRKNAFTPIDGGGCGEQPNYFEWTMRTGTTVDTTRPTVLATVPDSRYLADPAAFSPDNDVNRAPTLTIRLSEAIDPATINQSAADPANNTVVIRPFTTPPDPSTGLGGTTGAPIDPTTFDVAPNGANTGLEIQMVGSNLLDSFTWYEVTVQGLTDLCSNEQQPNPFRWVFETNDVAPGVASVYPTNGYAFACPNTDVQIRFSMSMYDIGSGSCAVDTNPTISGFVSEGRLTSPGGGRVFDVVPEDDFPGGSADPNRFCKRYAFRPDTALLNPNQTYQVGVNTRYQINESGDTLNYGDLANPPSAGPWSFQVKPANECANAPRIDALDPRRGPEGQCFTIQGRYFTEPKDGADEAYFDSTDLNAASTSWSDRNIVVRAPVDSVGGHQVTVQVEHPAPIGVLTSNAANFDLDPGTFDGACLERLSPSSGTWGTRFDAYGTGFGSVAGEVSFVGSPTGAAPHASWSDIFVNDARVLDNAESGNVFITRADGRESNQILFTVSPPVPGQPRVANAWPTCGTACVNAEVGARFNMEMNPSTFTAATVELRECDPGSSSCTAYVGADLATGYTYTGAPDHELIIGHDPLAIATNYRVIIRGGASGVKSAIGGELQFAGLNFDQDGDSNADAYSWLFATKDDPTECAVASVAITPAGTTTLRIGQFRDFRGIPRGSPDSCNPAGQDLDGRAYDWTWTTTDASTVPVTSNDTTPVDGRTDPVQRATAAAATVGETITAATSGYNASATVVVSPDPTICFNNSQCITNEVGRTCDSVCLDNRCTPVVNAVAPASAPETDWVTVQGCWFGNYAAGVSRVQFAPGLDGDVPGPAACGGPAGTWKNYEVVRAVPVGAANGPLSLTRDDGRIDATDSGRGPALADFTVTVGAPGPRICQLNPTSGPVGTADTIVGDSLGTRDPGDVVTFENNQDASSYPAWANQSIQTVVPTGAETGDVVVRKGPQTSNPLTFRVTGSSGGGSCAEICAVDPDCSSGGCGSDGCCAARPTLSSYSPVGIENCRNVVITATLGGPALDTTTVHSGTVILRQAGVPVTPVSFTANPHGFTLAPPLLDPATTYDIELTDNIRTTKGVRFGGYTWSFSTGTAVCNLDHIVLSPTSHTFTRITPPGHTRGFNAYAVAANNTQIFPVPNVYNWNWGWSVSNAAVATITGSTSDTETATA
ncbi:MAG: IPT/TIG domain-containing protein, partial [Candidatus Kerfeldbacteria bacterium]|nr:IPT/TIG domain-containing protein [Candidatus Kerfeldbacteria bacterium]